MGGQSPPAGDLDHQEDNDGQTVVSKRNVPEIIIGNAEELDSLLESGALEMSSSESWTRRKDSDGESPTNRRTSRGAVVASKEQSGVEEKVSQSAMIAMLCGHAFSASLLLVVNKWALQVLPYVWVLTTMQFVPAVLVVGLAGSLGLVEVEPLKLRKLIAFMPAAGMFFITMTAGNAVVKHSNVDTFIVMRALVPIPAAFLETLSLGEPCPSAKSWLGLCTLVFGAVCFASANRGIAIRSASWVTLFLVMMPVDAVLIKHLINTTGLSPWGLVLYQNLIAGCLGIFCVLVFELNSERARSDFAQKLSGGGKATMMPVLLSCCLGISVSFFQMKVRRIVSSTAFMVLGVSNKLLALLINQLTMKANSSVFSVGSVLLSIGGALFFQQTVKGKGISQAPRLKTESSSANAKAYFAMLAGLVWAGILNVSEKAA